MAQNQKNTQAQKIYPAPSMQHPVRNLPLQYLKAVFVPTARTFAQAVEYANWGVIRFQLIVLVCIPVLLGALKDLFGDTSVGIDRRSNVLFDIIGTLAVGATAAATILKIIIIPIMFFIGSAVQFLFARMFGGRGRYMEHCYAILLYQVPLTLIGAIIVSFFLFFHLGAFFYAPVVSLLLFLVGMLISVSVVAGVHSLPRDKAMLAVFIPYMLGIVLVFVLVAMLAQGLTGGMQMLH